MNPETLRKIFKSPFDYKTYSNEIAHRLFGCNDVATSPELLDNNADGDKSYFIGQMEDADGRLLGFFYTHVADGGDVRRKRVGLRKLIQPYLKYDVDGAIAVFDDGNHWRLSYICDLKEGNTAAKRFSYILGDEQGQYKTPLERLGKVAEKNGRFKLSDLREAFSVDALSKEFFDEYHRHYDIIINELKRQGFEGATIHDYVKKMMGRIVFLHFLQKKGWLNGNLAFLRDLFFFSPHQGDFLEQVLEPLFFGIFNTENANREQLFKAKGWDMGLLEDWKELPYLNGGLFERDAVDEQNITLPASLFEDLFTFMASYNFTVDENDPDDAEVGVDPEMLGKIFESLLEDNKAKGAFYTPKEIVRYMCKESLIAYLGTRTSSSANGLEAHIRSFVETHEMQPELEPYRDSLDTALREVKICDPAIGSGAFPMGLLNELWRCREALSQSERKEPKENSDSSFSSDCNKENSDCAISRVELKKEIIENNIYGVDIERGAIDIARLRFWLSIVVDAEKPEPLPNFDYKFMQGNSLIESYKGIALSRISNRLRGGQSKSTQLLLGLDSDFSKKNLQRLMRDYFSVTDHKQKASMRQAINDEVKRLITDFIGGTAADIDKVGRDVVDIDKLDPSANQDFFLWHTWFKDIFDNGGFDIVIANPPYISIRTKNFPVQLKEMYKKTYSLAVGQYDVYTLFIEHGCRILSKHGILSYIIPTRMLSNENFKPARDYVNNNIPIFSYVNAEAPFETASVEANIMICKKGSHVDSVDCYRFSPSEKTFNRISTIAYSDISIMPFGIFPFTYEDKVIRLLNKIQNVNSIELGYYLAITRGFECGYNNPVIGIGEMPFIKSENIKAYYPAPSNLVCNPDFTNTTVYKTEQVFCNKPKLITKFCSDKIQFSLDEVGYCNTNSVYNCTQKKKCDINYLLAILNSKVTTFWFNTAFMNIDGLFPHIQKNQLEAIPIPVVRSSYQTITDIVEQIIGIKRKDPSADTSKLEQEIDQQVYTLYSLTPEEIAIIEQ